MKCMKLGAIALLALGLSACGSVAVEKLNPEDPSGVPFYLTKPMKKITTTEYTFLDANQNPPLVLRQYQSVEAQIVNVVDRSAAYTINHTRSFAGESTLKLKRSAADNGISSSDLAEVEAESKEGLTEFLKGLFEGAKTLSEAQKTLAEAGAVAGAVTEGEATYFGTLLEKGIMVTKKIVSVDYVDL
jgi:hypothetical protein